MLYFITAFLACQEPKQNGFSTSGTGVNPNELGSTQSGSTSSGSSGSGSGSGGTSSGNLAEADNDDAPQISGVDAFFTEYEGLGDIIEVHVYYSDTQDDVEGGSMTLGYSNGETEGTESLSLDDTNASALLEAGEVTILFSNVDTALDYQFRLRMSDAEGNQSNEYTAVAASVE